MAITCILISAVREVVVITVERALPLVSPGYTPGMTEEEVREDWKRYCDRVPRVTMPDPVRDMELIPNQKGYTG